MCRAKKPKQHALPGMLSCGGVQTQAPVLQPGVTDVPILGVIGDQDDSEYTVIPIKDAVELLKTENSRAEVYQVENSNHVFSGKEAEVIALIADFMQRKILV